MTDRENQFRLWAENRIRQGIKGTDFVTEFDARPLSFIEMTAIVEELRMLDSGRDLDIRIATILGWTNIDWHFDRTIPMHTWLGGTPLGAGHIEEIPEYSHDGNALITLLGWLARHYDVVELYSDCGYWFCRLKDIVTFKIIADPQCGYLTPSEAVCAVILEIEDNERT